MTNWLTKLLYDKYEVTMWYKDGDNTVTNVLEMSELKKIDKTTIKGRDIAGSKIDIKTTYEFNYQVRKIY